MWRYPDIPILAQPEILPQLDASGEWLCQLKYNGWRCVLEWNGEIATWTSRHRKGIASAVSPEVAAEASAWLKHCPAGTTFDAELLGRRDDVRVKGLVVFDILTWGGQWLDESTLDRFTRLRIFTDTLPQGPRVVECVDDGFAAMFEEARNNPSVEGVVLKRRDAKYIGSVRKCAENPGWIKVKFRGGEDGNTPL